MDGGLKGWMLRGMKPIMKGNEITFYRGFYICGGLRVFHLLEGNDFHG